MRLRHAVVTDALPGLATVIIDGADVPVLVSSDATLPVGGVATLLQEGRHLVALGTQPVAPIQS